MYWAYRLFYIYRFNNVFTILLYNIYQTIDYSNMHTYIYIVNSI